MYTKCWHKHSLIYWSIELLHFMSTHVFWLELCCVCIFNFVCVLDRCLYFLSENIALNNLLQTQLCTFSFKVLITLWSFFWCCYLKNEKFLSTIFVCPQFDLNGFGGLNCLFDQIDRIENYDYKCYQNANCCVFLFLFFFVKLVIFPPHMHSLNLQKISFPIFATFYAEFNIVSATWDFMKLMCHINQTKKMRKSVRITELEKLETLLFPYLLNCMQVCLDNCCGYVLNLLNIVIKIDVCLWH